MIDTFSNYPEFVTCGYKNKGREVKKAMNVAVQDSSKPGIFVGKGREKKVIKTGIRTVEAGSNSIINKKKTNYISKTNKHFYPITKNLFRRI